MAENSKIHNEESDSIQVSEDAIGETLFSKSWVLQTLQNIKENPENYQDDLESLSEMSTDDEVAKFLCIENCQFTLLSTFLKSNFRSQEFVLTILSNMLRQNFEIFQHEATCLQIPMSVLDQDLSTDPDFVQVLVVLFQYLTIFYDLLAANMDENEDLKEHFEVTQKVILIMASTLNEDLLKKSTRFLFSILDLASEVQEPLSKIGFLLSPPALGYLNEALKQALKHNDDKTAFLIIEILAALFDHLDEDQYQVLDQEHADQLLDTINVHLNEESTELDSVKSCAKVSVILWTSTCHLPSFETIAKVYLDKNDEQNEEDLNFAYDVIKQCLKHFLTVHSAKILSDEKLLAKSVIRDIVSVLT